MQPFRGGQRQRRPETMTGRLVLRTKMALILQVKAVGHRYIGAPVE